MTSSGDVTSDGGRHSPVRIGRYRIERPLGKGGMGCVYEAFDEQLERRVALKVPHPLVRGAPDTLQRFLREARAAAQLMHPGLCPVFDAGQHGELHYLAMAYIEGQPLTEAVAELSRQSPQRSLVLIETVARALHEAHTHGVIHRDLKPANIILKQDGQPVVVDFGLALRASDPRITAEGCHPGTPAYMAPEQMSGDPNDVTLRCDVYSLGVVLYELLTGRRPFEGTTLEVSHAHLTRPPTPPSTLRPQLDRALDALCLRALAKQPQDRYASMLEFAEAIAAVERGLLSQTAAGDTQVLAGSRETPTPVVQDPRVVRESLELLEQWGWQVGLSRLKQQMQAAEDPSRRANLTFLCAWLAGELGAHEEAGTLFEEAGAKSELEGWALVGRAFVEIRQSKYGAAHTWLNQAETKVVAEDRVLRATIVHCRSAAWHHQGKTEDARNASFEALELFGPHHFGTGRVLDTLGAIYQARGDLLTSRQCYLEALRLKERFKDESGLAVTNGQLGRLYLKWGFLEEAERHFRKDLDIAQRICDLRGQVQMYNHLGQVLLARGQTRRAADYLDESLRLCEQGKWHIPEAYARKDRALAHLKQGDAAAAQRLAEAARSTFQDLQHVEGGSHADRVLGMALAQAGRSAEAEQALQRSASCFDEIGEPAEAARSLMELAQARRQRGASAGIVAETLLSALERAEGCRDEGLSRELARRLAEADEAEYCRWAYRRVRGRGIGDDALSLLSGQAEMASVLFLDLKDFSQYVRAEDPAIVIATLNQAFHELTSALTAHDVQINQYLGDGFMALSRGAGHARRAVAAALDALATMESYNRPRRLMRLPELIARIGIGTGPLVLGNVGTLRKIDFTAVGTSTNLAARLQSEALPGLPCISQATHELVRGDFQFAATNPRTVQPKNFPSQQVWDVVGRANS